MNQTILFSPVGGTDPISPSNFRDGSMLHICRKYQPEKVILYLSDEMLENHKMDNRYLYCLDMLAEHQKRVRSQYQLIERPGLKNVHEFDYYYQDFRTIIEEIFSQMDDTDTLLLNISSGTPAMKSGLLVLATLGEFPCKLVQVATPEKKINEHIHKDYDVITLWDLNMDNFDYEDRCREVECPTLSLIKKEEIIKNHIDVYDYQAALAVAQTIPEKYTKNYIELLKMASLRLLLNMKDADKIAQSEKFTYLTVQDGSVRKDYEYALNLNIKQKREEYADFIRALTPLIADLFKMIVKRQCKIDIDKYCRDTKTGKAWDESKLKGTDVEKALNAKYADFRYGIVYSDHLKGIVDYFSTDLKLLEIVENLRKTESSIRNLAAHDIVSVTEEVIKSYTSFSSLQIWKYIKAAFAYAGMNIKEEYWNSYDDMNEEIKKRIG